jgi:hypothetical protein
VYLRARDYDPATAQFLTVDPAVDETRQPYAYVANNPLLATDPTGLCLFSRSNGRCRGGGVLDTVVLNGPSAHTLQTGVLGSVITTFEGIGDGASFGLTQQARNAIDPNSECFVNKNGFYYGGVVTGVVASTVITAGASEGAAAGSTATGAAERATTTATEAASGAESALNGARLREHLSRLEEYGRAGSRDLESGRIRYYGDVSPANKPGEMVGRRLVREWDPSSGATRTWHETLDGNGNVRIVRPETGGSKIHYYFDEFGNYGGSW